RRVRVLQQVAETAVEHARPAGAKCRGVPVGGDALASRLDADQLHLLIVEKGGEDADRIGAATHARDDGVWQPPSTLQYLGARLAADDGLEVAHQTRKGIRPDDRADRSEERRVGKR